jgi:hypothetical protein
MKSHLITALAAVGAAALTAVVTGSSATATTTPPDVCSALGMPGNATTICRTATSEGEPWSYVGTATNPADHTSHSYCWDITSNPTHAAFWCPDASWQVVVS